MSILLWRQIQRENFTDWKKLLTYLELDLTAAESIVLQSSKFPLNIPKRLAQKIDRGNWEDPILCQFLPTLKEQEPSPLFVLNPIGDEESRKTSKLLHKYHGRALLVCTSACAMHCRFCFRQHFPYETEVKPFDKELEEIAKDPSLNEIILSGGDPLSMSNAQLERLFNDLGAISHLKKIRFHTRFPMGIPERIDEEFLQILKSCPKQVIFIVHCNHPKEFDADVFQSLKKVQKLGIPILTQSVLLKGINDDVATLQELFSLLVDNGILPYYLHQLDRVQGAAHFEVSEAKGLELMQQVATLLPGYALPKYVREIAGEPMKTPVF